MTVQMSLLFSTISTGRASTGCLHSGRLHAVRGFSFWFHFHGCTREWFWSSLPLLSPAAVAVTRLVDPSHCLCCAHIICLASVDKKPSTGESSLPPHLIHHLRYRGFAVTPAWEASRVLPLPKGVPGCSLTSYPGPLFRLGRLNQLFLAIMHKKLSLFTNPKLIFTEVFFTNMNFICIYLTLEVLIDNTIFSDDFQ